MSDRLVTVSYNLPADLVDLLRRVARQRADEIREARAQGAVEGRVDVAQVRIRHRSLCSQLGLESEVLDRFWIELSHLLSGIAARGVLSERDRDAVLSGEANC